MGTFTVGWLHWVGGMGNCGVIYTAVTGMEFGVHGEAKLRDEECVGAG